MTQDHVCHNEGRISKLESDVHHQEEQDSRIEANLNHLVDAVHRNVEAQQSFEVKIASNFGKLEAILEEQSARSKEVKQTQDEIKGSLDKLSTRVAGIERDVKQNSEDINNVRQSQTDYDKRLSKVEKMAIYVMAIIAVLSFLVSAISSFDSIKYKLFPELNNITIEQKATNK